MPEDRAAQLRRDFTTLLRRWRSGDSEASEQVLVTAYEELRQLAANYLHSGFQARTLQPTALVNELCLKLLSRNAIDYQDRNHFLALCARQMRFILVDYFRRRSAERRGGGAILVSLDEHESGVVADEETFLDLHLALEQLEREDPRVAQVVEMRYFGGLTEEETAQVLGISVATVKRDWTFARAWLMSRLRMP